jgi:hypothetical protein
MHRSLEECGAVARARARENGLGIAVALFADRQLRDVEGQEWVAVAADAAGNTDVVRVTFAGYEPQLAIPPELRERLEHALAERAAAAAPQHTRLAWLAQADVILWPEAWGALVRDGTDSAHETSGDTR